MPMLLTFIRWKIRYDDYTVEALNELGEASREIVAGLGHRECVDMCCAWLKQND